MGGIEAAQTYDQRIKPKQPLKKRIKN
jgi:hypothetical protein